MGLPEPCLKQNPASFHFKEQKGINMQYEYGKRVSIKGTVSDLDGLTGRLVGVASFNIVNFYIVRLDKARFDEFEYNSLSLPECNLESVT